MRVSLAPIELLHPLGAPRGTTVLGSGVPEWLVPREPGREDGADLVLVDAAAGEPDELARAATAARAAAGIVVVSGRRASRARVVAALARQGVTRVHEGVARRDRGSEGIALVVGKDDRSSASGGHGARRRIALGRRDAVGLSICGTEGGGDLCAWLGGPGEGAVVVRTSWRGLDDSAVVSRLVNGEPTVFAKLGLGASTADVGAREASALERLGGAARHAGARVPNVRGVATLVERRVALLSPLSGRVLARGSRATIERGVERLVDWLGQFASATLAHAPAPALLEETVLRPASAVVLGLEGGGAYMDALRRLAGEIGDASIPVTAAHGDLTLWNVLDGRDGEEIGIVDWAGSSDVALPLLDLPYALVDGRAAQHRYGSRADAFLACFPVADGSSFDGPTSVERLTKLLGVPPVAAVLAFHGCWLGHAADEVRRGVEGPFLAIARILAARGIA